MELQPSENNALDTAALLIKYAAESPKSLPDTIVSPIANAWKAREEKTWSPDIATKFWTAYSALCDLPKPATLDTINASMPSLKSRRWILFGPPQPISLTQRTTRRYLCLLFFLLAIAILFGFIASEGNKLSSDIDDLITKGNVAVGDVVASLGSIKLDLDKAAAANENPLQMSLDDRRFTPELRTKINKLRDQLQAMYYAADVMRKKADMISRITLLSPIPYEEGDLSRLPILEHGFDNVKNYYRTRRSVTQIKDNVHMWNSIYAALVPLLLGAIGACTYVLRRMSDEIGKFTFASTSPTTHLVRVMLGALAGVATGLGLGGGVAASGISAAALAFLAGYAVEPVFATFDGLAEKFRRDGAGSTGGSQ